MEQKQQPFTAYDFLGYLFPGAAMLLLLDASIAYHFSDTGLSYDDLISRYGTKELAALVPFLVAAYILGHVLSYASAAFVERYAIWSYNHPRNYLLGLKHGGYYDVQGANPTLSKVLRTITWFLLLPISIPDFAFGKVLGLRKNYIKPFDPLIRAAVWRSINKLVHKCVKKPRDYGKPADHDFASLAVHYVLEKAPNHIATLRNYVVLYGFLRTNAMLFVFVFWLVVFHLPFVSWPWYQGFAMSIAVVALCFGSYAAFVKFFQRYNEDAFFALTICMLDEPNKVSISAVLPIQSPRVGPEI